MAEPAPADDHLQSQTVQRTLSAALDPDFYRAVYTDLPPDVGPLWHYRVQGWREGRDPAPWFSTADYLATYPDVERSGVEPFFHFLTDGRWEGREIVPSRHAAAYFGAADWAPPAWTHEAFGFVRRTHHRRVRRAVPLTEEQRAAVAEAFDAAYYLAMNPDVAAAGGDPLDHFIDAGWQEGRDPSPRFSIHHYLETNPDVEQAGVNPFAHYLVAGRHEGRAPRHDLGFRYDVISRLKPMPDRIAAAARASLAQRTSPPERLAAGLGHLSDLHLTFSHDNYADHFGGLQLCLRRESARFADLGVDHLHLYPAAPWPVLRADPEPGPLGVLLNGRSLGVYAPQAVRDALAGAVSAKGRRSVAIHSLLGHEPGMTADIAAGAGVTEGFFWLHDFASLCAGFHLVRNDVEDCAAPPADSVACGVCVYGPERARHLDGHRRLFERLRLTVVAPSEATLDFWRSRTELLAAGTVVLPHARLEPRGDAPASPHQPFRLAYLGMPNPLKGWPIFRELAERLADDPRYEFLHFGARPDAAAPVSFQEVIGTAERPKAMQEALEAGGVDAALIWPICRETFSFTAYEAAAAGAAVITGPDSGNVAAFAADPAIGRVLPDEAALVAAFETGEILALARGRRRAQVYDLAYSGMTAELVR
ncbi:MAG: hypothetical protein ACOY5Y_03675 [Pseudomonadota bacterium]